MKLLLYLMSLESFVDSLPRKLAELLISLVDKVFASFDIYSSQIRNELSQHVPEK